MTQAEKNLHEAVLTLIQENEVRALSVLAGHFVGLAVALVELDGHVDDRDIFIDGGAARDVTIHKKKGGEA